jgi:hypothetical protein
MNMTLPRKKRRRTTVGWMEGIQVVVAETGLKAGQ